MNSLIFKHLKYLLLGGVLYSCASQAQNVDVTFNANILETTCEIKIVGGSGDGQSNTIPIGEGGHIRLDQIENGDAAATAAFKLSITECPDGLSSIKTTVSGQQSSYIPTAIISSGTGSFLGIQIARSSSPTTPFVINSTEDSERLIWNADEISSKEVDLIASLIETQVGQGTTGSFSAVATFNFTYQ